MTNRALAASFALIAVLLLVPAPAVAQATSSEAWMAPTTAWGDPDIQGIWNNVTATRLERPANLGEKAVLTDEEAAQFEQEAIERRAVNEAKSTEEHLRAGTGTGYAASVWFESSDSLSGNRTSLLVDPPDGRLPPLTSLAEKVVQTQRDARRERPADTWWDRGPYERCVSRGLPGSMMPGFYNHNYQILQTPGYVTILVEMIHDARIIPMDGRPHVDNDIKQWLGDSRGRWEGDTLVVETVNLPHVDQRNVAVYGTSEQGRVIERFTRLDADTMDYQVTVDDPPTFTGPWTASIPMTKVEGPLYEYACHEGNYGLPNILAGHRREEGLAVESRSHAR